MEDVDTIKDIVNLGRSARNKSNLKIRQPLADIKVFISKDSVLVIEKISIKYLKN